MKCPICDGTGTSNTCVNGTFKPCTFCDGTGEVKDNLCKTCGTICPFDDERTECDAYAPMTNENWFISLSTEEKAKWITENLSVYADSWVKRDEKLLNPATWVDWLKEKHNDSM